MPKTIIISESLLKNRRLMEAVENDVFPMDLRNDILKGIAPISNNYAVPQDSEFIDTLCSKIYEKAKRLGDAGDNAAEIIKTIKEKEKPLQDNLSAFVAKKVCQLFSVPEDTIDFAFNLVDGIDQSKTNVAFGPDEQTPVNVLQAYSQDEINDEVSKRKTIDILVAGAADFYTRQILDDSIGELDDFNVSLHSLYKNYLNACQYNLFCGDRQKLSEKDKKLTGISIVKIGNQERKNMLVADGVITPVLMYETIKGFFDMFAAHGLPEDRGMECLVLSKCDYISAEPWNMRLGPELFGRLTGCIPEQAEDVAKLMPYIFMKLCSLPALKFNSLMQEVFEGTDAARRTMARIAEYADKRFQLDKFDNKVSGAIDYDSGVITDQFIEANEL